MSRSRYKGEEVEASALVKGDVVLFEPEVFREVPDVDRYPYDETFKRKKFQSPGVQARAAATKEPVFGVVDQDFPVKGKDGYYSNYRGNMQQFRIMWRYSRGKEKVWMRDTQMIPRDFPYYRMTGSMKGVVLRGVNEERLLNLRGFLPNPGFTVGGDPEIFVLNSKTGRVIPSWEFLVDRKTAKSQGHFAYWDGFQAEFGWQPVTCLDGMVICIRQGLASVLNQARAKNKDAVLSLQTVINIEPEDMEKYGDEHVAFGCGASINAYGDLPQVLPVNPREILWRPAGGHLHFGQQTLRNQAIAAKTVKMLDRVIGVASVSLFDGYEDSRRRTMYGLAGEYRMPAHGLEYRTLSNLWLASPGIAQLIYDLARVVARVGMHGFEGCWDATDQETKDAINHTDTKLARMLLERNRTPLQRMLIAAYGAKDATSKVPLYNGAVGLHAILNGIDTVCDPREVMGNWQLDPKKTTREGTLTRWSTLAEHNAKKLGISTGY